MSNVKIKLNSAGVRKLLRSPEMRNGLSEIAFSAQAKLGDGYEATYYTEQTRAVAEITAVSPKAIQENNDTNSILRALK